MTLKKRLLNLAKHNVKRQFQNQKVAFPGIEHDIEQPEEFNPSTLRPDKDEKIETIEQQRRGSVQRLLRDRFVDDGGYLQSRSPFPLNGPLWDEMDQDRPQMTPEGILWEDINHFADYLTCKDIELAYKLNEMLLNSPKDALHQFKTLCRLMNKPLCRHEALGRGYAFSREPVLSPSTHVACLVLQKRMNDLEKGLGYLWVLNQKYVEKQRVEVQGFDLKRLSQSALLLSEVFHVLHISMFWTEAHFVQELKTMSMMFPDLALSLPEINGKFVLAQLLLDRQIMTRRYLDLLRALKEEVSAVELFNHLGSNPDLFLYSDDLTFESFIRCFEVFKSFNLSWAEIVVLCKTIFEDWKDDKLPIERLPQHLENINKLSPRALSSSLKDTSKLKDMLQNAESTIERISELQEKNHVYCELLESIPWILSRTDTIDTLHQQMSILTEGLPDLSLYGPLSIQSLISYDPKILLEAQSCIKAYHELWPVVCKVLNKDELRVFKNSLKTQDVIKGFSKLQEVITVLKENFDQEKEDAMDLFSSFGERIRTWKRKSSVPPELVRLMNDLPANQIAELLLMDAESFQSIEKSLFLMFGHSPPFVASCLVQMPELLTDTESRDLALLASRCRKLSIKNLHDPNPPFSDQLLSFLMTVIKLTKQRPNMHEKESILFLEKLSEMKLLDHAYQEETEKRAIQVAQFLILCVEHPDAWSQFISLIKAIVNPVLQSWNKDYVHKMQEEAFLTILQCPEIFLLPDLWNAMLTKLQDEKWSFAGLDLETVQETEPCLLYYVVQCYWREKYNRDPFQLVNTKSSSHQEIKRRGKSIIN